MLKATKVYSSVTPRAHQSLAGALLSVVSQAARLMEQPLSHRLLEQRENVGEHTLCPETSA